METRFHEVFPVLKSKGIEVDLATFSKHHTQGFMSDVHSAESSAGPLIFRWMRLDAPQKHLQAWKKFEVISEALKNSPLIPVAEMYAVTVSEDSFIAVQRCLPGEKAGHRDFTGGNSINHWRVKKESLRPRVEEIFAQIHRIPAKGFGLPILSKIVPTALYESWIEYLEKESAYWLDDISKTEYSIYGTTTPIVEAAKKFLDDRMHELAYDGPPALVHGDLTNPSNILLEGNRISGIIDWEMALNADPAWEFGYSSEYDLEFYFDKAHIPHSAQKSFRRRTELYNAVISIFWTYLHSSNPHGELYPRCILQLERALADY